MPNNIDYFKAIQGTLGVNSYPQSGVREAQDRMRDDLVNSLNYDEINATRNGVKQGFLVTTTEYGNQGQVRALPGDELYVGDLIGFAGEYWIVTDVTPVNPFYRMGLMKLCNYTLRFQNFSHTIYERRCFIDGGAYATYVKGDTRIQYGNEKATVYLPYDDATKKLFIDKRISIGTLYDKRGAEILQCYKIIGVDYRTVSYGEGSHLMILHIEQDAYSPVEDNFTESICDYIPKSSDNPEPGSGNKSCKIEGVHSVKVGFSRTFKAVFIDNAEELVEGVVPSWTISIPQTVTGKVTGQTLTNGDFRVKVTDDPTAIGAVVEITLTDENEAYGSYGISVEVTS